MYSWDLKTLKWLQTYVHLSVWKQLLTNFNHSKHQGQTGSILYCYRKVEINWKDIITTFFGHAWDTVMCYWHGKKVQLYFSLNPVRKAILKKSNLVKTWFFAKYVVGACWKTHILTKCKCTILAGKNSFYKNLSSNKLIFWHKWLESIVAELLFCSSRKFAVGYAGRWGQDCKSKSSQCYSEKSEMLKRRKSRIRTRPSPRISSTQV